MTTHRESSTSCTPNCTDCWIFTILDMENQFQHSHHHREWVISVYMVTEIETLKVINSCPLKTSPLDFMPASLIKDCSDVFGSLICKLAKLSFAEGTFPEMFKIGQVSALIKKPGADASEPANYRPITNLNTIGKIIERLAKNQLRQHMTSSPNLNTSQSAYRALHSTETAMTKVVNDLMTSVDSGKPSVLLSLDISTAFDMLDHDRLLHRATELFGLSDRVVNWLKSYLTGRTSYVSIGNSREFHKVRSLGLSCFPFSLHPSVVLSLNLMCPVTSMQTIHNCIHLSICWVLTI